MKKYAKYARLAILGLVIIPLVGCNNITRKEMMITPGQSHLTLEKQIGKTYISKDIIENKRGELNLLAQMISEDFLTNSTGAMHLTLTAPNKRDAFKWRKSLTKRLLDTGLTADNIVATPIIDKTAENLGIIITYPRVELILPECSDAPLTYNFTAGCALDRQIGKMVARPSDLYGNDRLAKRGGAESVDAITRTLSRENEPLPSLLENYSTTGD